MKTRRIFAALCTSVGKREKAARYGIAVWLSTLVLASGLSGADLLGSGTEWIEAEVAYQSEPETSPLVCDEYAGDPDPQTEREAWLARDRNNQACSTERQQDNLRNPAFLRKWAIENFEAYGNYPGIITGELSDPMRLHLNPIYWNPSSKVTDPFRMPDEWEAAGRGQMMRFTFVSSTGAHLNARLYSPFPDDSGGLLPGITFTPGLQSYNEVNSWFAQGLAEAGYIVLIIDPQGQGDSENFSHDEDGNITGSDTDDTRSAIEFLLSSPGSPHPYAVGDNAEGTLHYNPLWARLDPQRIGIAGHSRGAIAVTPIGQADPRVKAVVSYDNLDGVPPANPLPTTPSLFFYTDYPFPIFSTPMNPDSPPDPEGHMGAFDRLQAAGVDVMSVTTRASTHYEWGYQPFPASFPATRYGERISFHYTLAWFDRYLKGDVSATERLATLTFDDSSDRHSIGAGTFDPELLLADPFNPAAGNVPYEIAGECVANLLSFYYHSAYHLEGGALASSDMRGRGCDPDPGEDPDPAWTVALQPPLAATEADGETVINTVRQGRVIPVTYEVFHEGVEQRDGTFNVRLTPFACPDSAGAGEVGEPTSPGGANDGRAFRWSDEADAWTYNLDTGPLAADTCFRADIALEDDTVISRNEWAVLEISE